MTQKTLRNFSTTSFKLADNPRPVTAEVTATESRLGKEVDELEEYSGKANDIVEDKGNKLYSKVENLKSSVENFEGNNPLTAETSNRLDDVNDRFDGLRKKMDEQHEQETINENVWSFFITNNSIQAAKAKLDVLARDPLIGAGAGEVIKDLSNNAIECERDLKVYNEFEKELAKVEEDCESKWKEYEDFMKPFENNSSNETGATFPQDSSDIHRDDYTDYTDDVD